MIPCVGPAPDMIDVSEQDTRDVVLVFLPGAWAFELHEPDPCVREVLLVPGGWGEWVEL